MKKSRFFSLLCAFCPGAGEMYLGLMKRGTAIMLLFWGGIGLMALMQLEVLLFLMPVLWFYSFFDTLTLRNLDYYALTELQEKDDFFFQDLTGGRDGFVTMVTKHHVLVGGGLIVLGATLLYNRLMYWLFWNDLVPRWLANFFKTLPSMVMAFAVIALGLWLVRGKRMPADKVDDYPQYHGETAKESNEK